MPKDKSIKKVLVIGSGPIVIGQAAGLGAGVVELRGLAYDYGPGANDENLFDSAVLRHRLHPPSSK